MNDFRADLHCHSTYSDGSETPETIVQIALKNGLQALSITDHDTVAAYEEAIPLCKKAGITLITGVEFSTALKGVSIHILGYGFHPDAPSIQELCSRHTERRESRNLQMLELLSKHGMDITREDLDEAISSEATGSGRTIGRPHIALAMIKKGYVSTPQEAFNKYLGEGRLCYVQGTTFTVDETIDAIHEAKGVAIIAHPHLVKNSAIVSELLKKPFDGMECYYGKFPSNDHKRWLKLARKKGWLITGGSDFHGKAKPNLELGCSWIGREEFNALLEKCDSQNDLINN